MSLKIPFVSSIVTRVIVIVFVLIAALMVGSFYVGQLAIKKHARAYFQGTIADVADISAKNLALPVWNYNRDQIMAQISSVRRIEGFCGAQVVDTDNDVLATAGFSDTLKATQFLSFTPIMFENPRKSGKKISEEIGSLKICFDSASQNAKINRLMGQYFMLFALLAFLVPMICMYVLRVALNPLTKIRHAMRDLHKSMQPITDMDLNRNDEFGAVIKSFNDMVYELSHTYDSLKTSQIEADSANRAKSEFLANMSHELRTPLNSIIGMVQLLSKDGVSKEQQEMFTMIEESSKKLLEIVNDILDLSKIEAGEVRLEYIPFDAIKEIRHAVMSLMPLATQKELSLSYDFDRENLYVRGDPLRLGRIVMNLVGNALRYTEHGRVVVTVKTTMTDAKSVLVHCEVQDTGVGIPAAKLDKVFEKFTQGDASTTRKFGGTGLGLTITRELVELMHGHIGVDSVDGRGSKFWFDVPFDVIEFLPDAAEGNLGASAVRAAVDRVPIEKARILLAEDHTMNQAFMRKLFQRIGVGHYDIVENGVEAVRAVESGSYDIVLMDCHMPEMNGYDATHAIRALNNAVTSRVPIIAMTANAMAEDREKCLRSGMDEYISKPVDIQKFKEILSKWIRI